jgi:plastocyanin
MRRAIALIAALTSIFAFWGAKAGVQHPELNFAGPLTPSACVSEAGNVYETKQYAQEGWPRLKNGQYARYAKQGCQRLHFVFGPLKVAPGQNDVLINPVTIEKPAYDGYIVRFRPDLVNIDGSVPPIEQVHLHHGTWIQLAQAGQDFKLGNQDLFDTREYGSGPFFASGEEKTIGDFPRGFGFPVKGSDHWDLLYMVHNATAQPKVVYITYDVDYVAKADGQRMGMKDVYPVWLDVRPSAYPVYNVARSIGRAAKAGVPRGSCMWPAQMCALSNSFGDPEVGQGRPGNGLGRELNVFPPRGTDMGRVSNFQGATIVGLGGHLHPGGLTDEIDIVRGNRRAHVFTSEAEYWDHANHGIITNNPAQKTSWDFSMTVLGVPRWAIHVKPGDKVVINATYNNSVMASYENMGIVVAFVSPDKPNGQRALPGIDPFDDRYVVDASAIKTGTNGLTGACAGNAAAGIPAGGLAHYVGGKLVPQRSASGAYVLCTKGTVTHGHMPESGNYGGGFGTFKAPAGAYVNRIDIAGFLYAPGDLSTVTMSGVPRVHLGQKLTFFNEDMAANIYHTITACAYPCTGPTGTAFPIPNGLSSKGLKVDFDSNELGYSPSWGPAKGQIGYDGTFKPDGILGTLSVSGANGFAPGTYTYFCRIHPFMRGTFEVTK